MDMGALRAAAWERERGRCFVTGAPLGPVDGPWQLHHRRPGGKGGTSRPDQQTLPNVIALSERAHQQLVHGLPSIARAHGWLVSSISGPPPRALSLQHWAVGWVWLEEAGGYAPVRGPGSLPRRPRPAPAA